ncbi:MAG: PD40 domain-containing protein [Phaeodactylibacter sp.]|nr:PD40 domain-containing protein [Phaeodactylibacter sp.]
MRYPLILILWLFFSLSFTTFSQSDEPTLMLRHPSVSEQHVAFAYASDIWIADKDGGNPHRLTVHEGVEGYPVISPDGQWVAFSGNYDGNLDVYIVSTQGGQPRRLTYHPGGDIVRGWNGREVLFSSNRETFSNRFARLYAIGLEESMPRQLPMPEAHQGSISPDGRFTAYIKNPDPTEGGNTYRPFKGYRGGNAPKIWIFDNETYEVEEVPHDGSVNIYPIWADNNTVYFLSDRNGRMNVFSYSREDEEVRQVTSHQDYDVKTLHTNGAELTYEQAGRIHRMALRGREAQALPIVLNPNLPARRPRYEEGGEQIGPFGISPTGKRAVVEARGDIFTIPTDKGDIRNLTGTPGAFERFPAWSPDGQHIAYFSDAGGEYQLMISSQKGMEAPEVIPIESPTYFNAPVWSPDSKKLLFSDKNFNLYWLDVESKALRLIDTDTYSSPEQDFHAGWSPDSKWVTYSRQLDNRLKAVFVYELATGKPHQVTDGMSHADFPTFSRDGKHLFFAASTNYGLNAGWLDMTSYERDVASSLYAVVLSKEEPSPFRPESDEEPAPGEDAEEEEADAGKEGDADKPSGDVEPIRIDLEDMLSRIVALPAPARVYSALDGSVEGKLLYLEQVDNMPGNKLQAFDMEKRESETLMEGIFGYEISADGKKMIYAANGNTYGIVDAGSKASVGDGKLNTGGMKVYVDPPKEWAQIFNEVWRIERDFFYVENMHGVDWKAVKQKYEPFLPYVGHREDLNYLLAEMMGELVVGHNYVGGGDFPEIEEVNTGLLGADLTIENGLYRISRIYSGLNWNPTFRAPLTEPGVEVNEGDYILAIDGEALSGEENIFRRFRNTVGKQVVLTVNGQPGMQGAREVTVVPVDDDTNLRNMAWVEGNREKVDEMTDGRVAYVYLPNTGGGGYTFFNRYYFSQLGKEAVIIDERFNGGGSAADYIIDLLDRQLMNYWGTRAGKVQSTPMAAIFGPKAMIINEYAASGGDLLPFLFKEQDMGPLIGKRTLGILVGIYSYPQLMDGGFATAPRLGIFSKAGEWIIENEGVHPDIEVEMTPKAVIEGKDPQLERAVEEIMKKLPETPRPEVKKPAGPDRAVE